MTLTEQTTQLVERHPRLGLRRFIPLRHVTGLNERLAIQATLVFGTMWTFYVFVIYGALGAWLPEWQVPLLYWSNWIQLWSLPLLMVGTNRLSRVSEQRSKETHDAVMEELRLLREEQAEIRELASRSAGLSQADVEALITQIGERLGHHNAAPRG